MFGGIISSMECIAFEFVLDFKLERPSELRDELRGVIYFADYS